MGDVHCHIVAILMTELIRYKIFVTNKTFDSGVPDFFGVLLFERLRFISLLIITNNKLQVLDGIRNEPFMLKINRFLSSYFLLNWILNDVRCLMKSFHVQNMSHVQDLPHVHIC